MKQHPCGEGNFSSSVFIYANRQKPAATLSQATAVVSKPMCAAFFRPAEMGAEGGAEVIGGVMAVVLWLLEGEGRPDTEDRVGAVAVELLEKIVEDCKELVREVLIFFWCNSNLVFCSMVCEREGCDY